MKALFARKVIASSSPFRNFYAGLSAGTFNTETVVEHACGALRSSIA